MDLFSNQVVGKSKAEALARIIQYLDSDDIEGQFDSRTGEYNSKDKFLVTWNANYKGIPSEFSIDKCDSFYKAYSGCSAIYAVRGLFHEKQLGAYQSIERALIEVGMKLCGKKEKAAFYSKYVPPYNDRVKKRNEENAKNIDQPA